MVFSSNPLSLSVPEPAFESWLRDSGYLEILDHRTSSIPTTYTDPSTTTSTNSTITSGLISLLVTLLSLFTVNPFSKLTIDDFSGQTPSWSYGFVGFCDSYSFPSSPAQARLRVHENVKRYARNYATLFILFFACTLYGQALFFCVNFIFIYCCLLLDDRVGFGNWDLFGMWENVGEEKSYWSKSFVFLLSGVSIMFPQPADY